MSRPKIVTLNKTEQQVFATALHVENGGTLEPYENTSEFVENLIDGPNKTTLNQCKT